MCTYKFAFWNRVCFFRFEECEMNVEWVRGRRGNKDIRSVSKFNSMDYFQFENWLFIRDEKCDTRARARLTTA